MSNHTLDQLSKSTMAASQIAEELFKFNPENTTSHHIKAGVLQTFLHFKNKNSKYVGNIRGDISKALLTLAAVEISPEAEPARKTKGRRELKYFSAQEKALIEIFTDADTDAITVEQLPVSKEKDTRTLARAERNEVFKKT